MRKKSLLRILGVLAMLLCFGGMFAGEVIRMNGIDLGQLAIVKNQVIGRVLYYLFAIALLPSAALLVSAFQGNRTPRE